MDIFFNNNRDANYDIFVYLNNTRQWKWPSFYHILSERNQSLKKKKLCDYIYIKFKNRQTNMMLKRSGQWLLWRNKKGLRMTSGMQGDLSRVVVKWVLFPLCDKLKLMTCALFLICYILIKKSLWKLKLVHDIKPYEISFWKNLTLLFIKSHLPYLVLCYFLSTNKCLLFNSKFM